MIARALLAAAGLPSDDAVAERVDHGKSGDVVLRIRAPRPLFGKIVDPARRVRREELAHEAEALRWLDGRCGAPRLVWSGEVEGKPALVMEAIDGVALHEAPAEQAGDAAIAAIHALRTLHALPVAECPFDHRLAVRIPEAGRRVALGEVDQDDFDAERAGRRVEALWQELLAATPSREDLVVAHGDACWPNFILRRDGGAGLIDLGRLGVADRYQDLALFIRSAARNAPGLDVRALVRAHYPMTALDEEKLSFYRLLDEFF